MKKWDTYYLPTKRSRKYKKLSYFFSVNRTRAIQHARKIVVNETYGEGRLLNVFEHKEV